MPQSPRTALLPKNRRARHRQSVHENAQPDVLGHTEVMEQPLPTFKTHTPDTVQRAASVLMLRESTQGLEVFIQHRATTMDFAAGVVVYPGGRVDEQDSAAAGQVPDLVATAHAKRWAQTSVADLGDEHAAFAASVLAVAALREVWEETGATLSFQQLQPWANWVTPSGSPKRFDTFFYVAGLEPGQEPQHQTTEATTSQWITPTELLRASDAGRLRLMAPTRATLQAVHRLGSLHAVLGSSAQILPVRPVRAAVHPNR